MTQSGSLYGDSGDTRLGGLAVRQHGVVSILQLERLGYSKHEIHHRVRAGRLHRLHRGVYLFGYGRITLRGRWMASVLACGPGAVLSHRAAAALHDLRGAPWSPIDVTAATRHHLDGIRSHHARHLDAADITVVDAIPVTTVSRLMLDMAETLSAQRLRSLLEASQRAGSFDVTQIDAVVARNPGRHGIKPLCEAVAQLRDDAPWTQSNLEVRFLELVRSANLPEPLANVLVEGELVDFFWPDHRLVVEIDSYRFHKTRSVFEADRRRDVRLSLAGILVVRFTYRRVVDEPDQVARELARLLSRERGAPRPARSNP